MAGQHQPVVPCRDPGQGTHVVRHVAVRRRDDLLDLESEDGPLWDGEAPLKWRAANEEEIAEFRQVELEEEDEEDEEDDGPVIMFLVPLVEDDEDEEYEED